MVTLIGFEIEELETNEFAHIMDQVNKGYLGVSIEYLEDHSIVLGYELRVEEV